MTGFDPLLAGTGAGSVDKHNVTGEKRMGEGHVEAASVDYCIIGDKERGEEEMVMCPVRWPLALPFFCSLADSQACFCDLHVSHNLIPLCLCSAPSQPCPSDWRPMSLCSLLCLGAVFASHLCCSLTSANPHRLSLSLHPCHLGLLIISSLNLYHTQ